MSLVKCECGLRVRPRSLAVHQKYCVKRKKALRREYNQSITQTPEFRLGTLSAIPNIVAESFDVSTMSDVHFNDLVNRLTLLHKDKEKKEDELKLQKQLEEEKTKGLKIKNENFVLKELARKEKEELDRIEQTKRVSKTESKTIQKKEELEKSIIERTKQPEEKSKKEVIKSEIENIDSLLEKSLGEFPERSEKEVEEVKSKKKLGKPKKEKVAK